MEDDEEIQSQNSRSPSPPSNGRITVTVASSRQSLSPPPQKQHPASKNHGGGGNGREDCWSEGATEILIEAWGERYLELSRGNLKQKHWKEVAEVVSSRDDYSKTPKTDIQCKNRIDTVKKKFKADKAKGAPSKWVFFDRLDQLIGPTAKSTGTGGSGTKVPIAIPVGFRSAMNQFRANSAPESRQKRTAVVKKQNQKVQPRKRAVAETESEEEDEDEVSEESMESLPPEKRAKKVEKMGNSVKELTQAILKFGEAYEQAESAKLQQLVEMEKQRMKFAKELELQRMQFFMKTQMEISQLKNSRKGGHGNHHQSDCSN